MQRRKLPVLSLQLMSLYENRKYENNRKVELRMFLHNRIEFDENLENYLGYDLHDTLISPR